jgi:hypothetical protein
MGFHVHPAATKAHAFRFQAQSLFNSMIAAELDFATSTEHSLPG